MLTLGDRHYRSVPRQTHHMRTSPDPTLLSVSPTPCLTPAIIRHGERVARPGRPA
jgi:hypothetical protein